MTLPKSTNDRVLGRSSISACCTVVVPMLGGQRREVAAVVQAWTSKTEAGSNVWMVALALAVGVAAYLYIANADGLSTDAAAYAAKEAAYATEEAAGPVMKYLNLKVVSRWLACFYFTFVVVSCYLYILHASET